VTIRAKLYVAILLTVLGPLVTTAVALDGMGSLGDRFDEVQQRAERRALALDLKFGVTDVNGWQTAYGYDGGRSRPRFERSVAAFRADLRRARTTLTDARERELLDRLATGFEAFMALDSTAYRALRAGREERTSEIFLGPEIERFEDMAATAEELAGHEARRAAATEQAFDDARDDSRRRLIAVAFGAALVIVLLLVTASDIARLALEGERRRRSPAAEG
jgi:hypothetical protein